MTLTHHHFSIKHTEIDLTTGSVPKTVLLYALPIVATGLLTLLFHAADLIAVGQFCGKESVAAVGSTSALINLINNLFLGLSTGSGIALAQAIGAGQKDTVKKTIHTSVIIALFGGVLLTIVGIIFAPTFLVWMGTPDTVLDLASTYLRVYFAGMTAILVYHYLASLLRAMGDTVHPMIYLTIAGVANFGMNVFFIVVFDMGVAGVALATALSQLLAAFLALRLLIKRHDEYHFAFCDLKPDKEALKRIIGIGLPIGLRACCFSLSNVIIQSSVNALGDNAMAGKAAAGSLSDFIYVAMNAFAVASMNIAGQCKGAGKYKRIPQCMWMACGYLIIANGLISLILLPNAETFLSIYIPGETEAIAEGKVYLFWVAIVYFLCGCMDSFTYTSSGIGKTMVPTIISLIGACCLRIVLIVTLFPMEQFHTLKFLALTYPISWFVTSAVQLSYFYIVYHKEMKAHGKQATGEVCEG